MFGLYDTATLSDPHVQSMFQAISMGSQSALSAPAQPILQMRQRTLPSRESMRPKAPALPMWAQGLPSDLSSLPPPPRTKHVYKMDDPFSFTWTAWGVPWKVRKDRLENTCLSAQIELTGKDFMVKSGQPFLQDFFVTAWHVFEPVLGQQSNSTLGLSCRKYGSLGRCRRCPS